MNEDELLKIATRFREVLESLPDGSRTEGLSSIPTGSCGDASLLLGTYLIENGESPFDYVCGSTCDDHSDPSWSYHHWLQRDDLVIDITADQFQDCEEKVVVTTNSTWHSNLNGEVNGIADYRCFSEGIGYSRHSAYQVIVSQMAI